MSECDLSLARAMRQGVDRALTELSTSDQRGFVPAKIFARRERVKSALNLLVLALDAWEKQLIAESYE